MVLSENWKAFGYSSLAECARDYPYDGKPTGSEWSDERLKFPQGPVKSSIPKEMVLILRVLHARP